MVKEITALSALFEDAIEYFDFIGHFASDCSGDIVTTRKCGVFRASRQAAITKAFENDLHFFYK